MMEFDFAVIGANGIQGRIASRDLLESGHRVLLCALDKHGLESHLAHANAMFAPVDLRHPAQTGQVLRKSAARVVVNCAIDDFNLAVTRLCLELGVHCVDLDSTEEMTYAQLALTPGYQGKDRTAITGCGSTPGISNVMLRHARPKFDRIHTVKVGFAWDSNMEEFVTPFSLDTIEWEFREKAKMLRAGKFVEKAPEECQEEFDHFAIGRRRNYFVPHIEHHTFHEYLKDAGIQNITVYSSFPEHSYRTLKTLSELGLLSKQPVLVDGQPVTPLQVTAEALRRLPFPDGYTEQENIWLKVYGSRNGRPKLVEMDAVAETLPGWEEHTCNIDTGMPASIMAQMIHDGRIRERGVFAPEFVVPPEPFFEELGRRGITVYENRQPINGPVAVEPA
jgi:lysine 6-dehydrogenase